jgi:hypothetical protein
MPTSVGMTMNGRCPTGRQRFQFRCKPARVLGCPVVVEPHHPLLHHVHPLTTLSCGGYRWRLLMKPKRIVGALSRARAEHRHQNRLDA